MTVNRTVSQPHIVFCGCAYYDIIARAFKEQILAGLSQHGLKVEVVGDLCGLAANRDSRLKEWAQAESLAIIACYPRAVRWLFHAAGNPLPMDRVRLFNMRTQPPEEIVGGLMKDNGEVASSQLPVLSLLSTDNCQLTTGNCDQSSWVPWFPVLDYDRCQNCKQCLNFCLFGVYALSEQGKVEVRKPSGCKTNCPACARMCPQKAIIFPKYADAPINGEEVPAMIADSEGGPPVLSKDIYDQIRQRTAGRKRFSRAGEAPSTARSCPTLDGLRRELGIPDDVLNSLSPAEFQRIAARKNAEQPQSDARADDGRKGKEHDE